MFRMEELTAFQRDLLYVLAGMDEPNGVAIKTELEEYYKGEIHYGRLYPDLDSLVDKELVEKGHHDKRTNAYELTDDGHHELEAHREWEGRADRSLTWDGHGHDHEQQELRDRPRRSWDAAHAGARRHARGGPSLGS